MKMSQVAVGQKLRGYVVHERGEAHIPAPASSFTYAVQPRRRAGPALRPGRGRMASVALGCPPSLPIIRCQQLGPTAIVRIGSFDGTMQASDVSPASRSGLWHRAFPNLPGGCLPSGTEETWRRR